MKLVLDASATIALLLDEPLPGHVKEALIEALADGPIVPSIWKLEIANVLSLVTRRRALSIDQRGSFIQDLSRISFEVDATDVEQAWGEILTLIDFHGLSSYDAAYLELARRRRLPLATLDKALGKAAIADGVEVIGLEL